MESQPLLARRENELSERTKRELGGANLGNLKLLGKTVRELSTKTEDEAHLLLVGGMVKTEKQGKFHKDVDLVFWCPSLSTEYYRGGGHEKFDKFADFFKKVSERLGWKIEIENPWFLEYELCGDGKVVLSTGQGVPIEVLPVTTESLESSFKNYLRSEKDPYEVIF